jgi:hypothetical protein
MMALVLATTLAVIPMFAPYNQLILLPGLMVMAHTVRSLWKGGPLAHFLVILTALSVFWPWLAAAGMVVSLSFLPGSVVQRAWALPLFGGVSGARLCAGQRAAEHRAQPHSVQRGPQGR